MVDDIRTELWKYRIEKSKVVMLADLDHQVQLLLARSRIRTISLARVCFRRHQLPLGRGSIFWIVRVSGVKRFQDWKRPLFHWLRSPEDPSPRRPKAVLLWWLLAVNVAPSSQTWIKIVRSRRCPGSHAAGFGLPVATILRKRRRTVGELISCEPASRFQRKMI
jgi:hypothetical protein